MDRSLAGYSPQGRKESDMTEPLTVALSFMRMVIKGPPSLKGKIKPWHCGFNCASQKYAEVLSLIPVNMTVSVL